MVWAVVELGADLETSLDYEETKHVLEVNYGGNQFSSQGYDKGNCCSLRN
jgi:hypothetical protein